MSCKDSQPEQASRHRRLLTVEDHLRDAGFGSWVAESLASSTNSPMVRSLALDSGVCGVVGSQLALNRIGGLNGERFGELLGR
jgi:transketolase